MKRRKVPRRVPDYLRAHEVPPVLMALAPRWQPLFATAIYAGLRKGELLGLRKSNVDLAARLLTIERSYDRDTTKGGRAEVIPSPPSWCSTWSGRSRTLRTTCCSLLRTAR